MHGIENNDTQDIHIITFQPFDGQGSMLECLFTSETKSVNGQTAPNSHLDA